MSGSAIDECALHSSAAGTRAATCVDGRCDTPDRVTIFMVGKNRPSHGRFFPTIASSARAQVTGLRCPHRGAALAQHRPPKTDIGVLFLCEPSVPAPPRVIPARPPAP